MGAYSLRRVPQRGKMKRFALTLLSFSALIAVSRQKDLIVDLNGNGQYKTISACVNDANATDSCLVREGRYHEEIIVTEKEDIEIKGYQNERPIIDGTITNGGNIALERSIRS